ncbi:hypothetical protein CHS0354_011709 [Potamilus streckersoni]|uniref:Uncharacterized protein n=1 Tax=Potamilus streckersoni TaxID=2493646 RepID=A0AAE0SK81_9BIVA|nr:hypothetical protein CHS0354_011709 [Potamilus streckersoni]
MRSRAISPRSPLDKEEDKDKTLKDPDEINYFITVLVMHWGQIYLVYNPEVAEQELTYEKVNGIQFSEGKSLQTKVQNVL